MYRDYSENSNCNGMPASLLQGMHWQIDAAWVCHQTVFLINIWLIETLGPNFFCGVGLGWSYKFIKIFEVQAKIFFINQIGDWYHCRNNECPACRTHCASRRSLRDDPKYDALISALYPDIDKYEEEVYFGGHYFACHFRIWFTVSFSNFKNSLLSICPRNWLFMRRKGLAISRYIFQGFSFETLCPTTHIHLFWYR